MYDVAPFIAGQDMLQDVCPILLIVGAFGVAGISVSAVAVEFVVPAELIAVMYTLE